MSLFGKPRDHYDGADITPADPRTAEADRQAGAKALEDARQAEADGDLERAQELRRFLGD